jgi:membrane protein implicated in regulation of membrane protease activity
MRYWLAQLPGYLVGGAVVGVAWSHFGLPGWAAVGVIALLFVKDAVLFPYARRALESPHRAGHESLLGRSATVVDALAPEGRVRIEGELWRAVTERELAPVGEGVAVVVLEVRGLTLRVRPEA